MLCASPINLIDKNRPESGKYSIVKCRQCMPCRINQRQQWAARILLELLTNPKALFVTFTYNDENLPYFYDYPGGNLVKSDIQKFFKRLRRKLPNTTPIRYYAVGEYGEKTSRAHYHAIIYGLDFDDLQNHQLINNTWGMGFTYIGEVTPESASYVAQYTTKKITGAESENHYYGRLPEFNLTSRKPGLGYEAAQIIAKTLSAPKRRNFLFDNCLRMHGKRYPIDTYMLKSINAFMVEQTGKPLQRTTEETHLTLEELEEEKNKSNILAHRYGKNKSRNKI